MIFTIVNGMQRRTQSWFHSLFCGCLFSVVVQVDNAIDEKYAIQWLLLPPSSSSQLEVDHDKAEYCAHSLSLNS